MSAQCAGSIYDIHIPSGHYFTLPLGPKGSVGSPFGELYFSMVYSTSSSRHLCVFYPNIFFSTLNVYFRKKGKLSNMFSTASLLKPDASDLKRETAGI